MSDLILVPVGSCGLGGLSAAYLADLALNEVFAAVAYGVRRLVRNAPPVLGHLSGIAAVLTAAWTSLILGLAAAGLSTASPTPGSSAAAGTATDRPG
ncbi:hypothetical protein [Nonomuraea sp. NPDC003214]